MIVYDRPNGRFLGSFSWSQPYGLADYEEEWGRKWIDGVDYEFAISQPFYDKTGNIRPFADIKELNSRRLRAAQSEVDGTWNLLGWKLKDLIFDDAIDSPENILIDSKELSELLRFYIEDDYL